MEVDGQLTICSEIITSRDRGVVHCGFSSQASPTITKLATEFGLDGDPAKYKEIDVDTAFKLLETLLMKDMAYDDEIMPSDRAAELAERFLAEFGAEGVRYYTNGNFYEPRNPDALWTGISWNPVTKATFDTGILVISLQKSGCLWIEDED